MKITEIETMMEYNRWANQRLLSKVTQLSAEEFTLPERIGPNSIQQALLHIVDAEYFWRLAVQTGKGPSRRLSVGQLPDLKVLIDYWNLEAGQLSVYIAGLQDEDLQAKFEYRWGSSKPRQWVRWQCLVHIVNHGTQHRGEIGLVLGQLDLSPGSLDLITFITRQSVKAKLKRKK
jgi:uncharacterized damage-inducible protein DinB